MSDPAIADVDAIDGATLLTFLLRVKEGDFAARMPLDWTGVAGKVADGLNDVVSGNQALGAELARVGEVVGKQGRLSQRAALRGSTQGWSGSIESVNDLIDDLTRPTIEMQRVIGAEQGVDPAEPDRVELRRRFEIRFPRSPSRIEMVTSRPVAGRHGPTAGCVGTLADATAEVTASLARDEQFKAKDHFLSRVSHELRSPLSVVHQFTSLLSDGVGGPLTGDQREFLGWRCATSGSSSP